MSKTATYALIASHTVTGSNLLGTTGVTFTSIPSTYTDLLLVQDISLTAAAIVCIRVGNGSIDTGSNYSQTALSGNATTASSTRAINQTVWRSDLAHASTGKGSYISNIIDYSNATTNKTTIQRYNNFSYGALETVVGLWRNTNSIDRVQCLLDRAEYYVVGSTFNLYGIQAGNA